MRTIVIASLGLNALLVGALAYLTVRQPSPEPVAAPAAEAVEAGAPARVERVRKSSNPPTSSGSPFHWTQVESTDFRQYMENLRAVGCPEETIRDLIIAEVNKLFAPRFVALAAQAQRFENWNRRSKSRETLATELRALQEEKRALLRELLGIDDDPAAKWANADFDRLWQEGKYSFLPPEKQAAVRAIMEKYDQQLGAGTAARDGVILGSDAAKRLRAQREQELAQVLSPEELKELSLRDSNAADALRSRFGSMDLTEAEFRKLYDLRKAYEDSQGVVADYSDPERARQRSEARRQLEDAYQAAIGEERWTELQKQQDPTWRGLTQLAQQNNLSPATIDQAWQHQRQTGEQIMRLIEDRSMSPEQRDAVVQQLTAEHDQSLRSLLGEQAYQQYKQNNPGFTFSSGRGDSFSFVGPGGPFPGVGARSVEVTPNRTEIRTRVRAP